MRTLLPGAFATVTVTAAERVVLPAPSRARAVSACDPLTDVVVSQLAEYGALVSSPPSAAPSRKNWTPATVTSSDAFAVTLIDPNSVAPPPGEVIASVGGVVSVFATVTATAADVVVFPAPSRACAVTLCDPLLAVAVFHVAWYGAVVSSAPTWMPSTRNRTPATATSSDASAVTVIDPE